MKSLVLYSTIVGGFFASSEALDDAMQRARSRVGDDAWKRGFSANDPAGATVAASWELREAGIEPLLVEGELKLVGYIENTDNSGNVYPKLRVGLDALGSELLLSLDLKGDVAQRLVAKLSSCRPGSYVKISAWPTFVTRGDRQFVNHAVSMKTGNGSEIPVDASFSAEVKSLTESAESVLVAAGITDKKVLSTAKTAKRIEAHKNRILAMSHMFAQPVREAA